MATDLDARLAEWRTALLDTTKRNRLIKFVTGRVGGVSVVRPLAHELWHRLVRDGEELTFVWKRDVLGLPEEVLNAETLSADFDPGSGNAQLHEDAVRAEMLQLCLRSHKLKPSDLLTDQSDRFLAARLLRLKRTSEEGQTDHGVTTLFAAFGFLKWYESADSAEEVLSPLLLVPVKLARETVESPFMLAAEEDDVLPNHCLEELLHAQFRIKLPTAAECPLDPEDPDAFRKYLAAVQERVKHVPRWEVVEGAALGVFNFQKLAMWEDLGRNAERVKAHPLCRAVAGDAAVPLLPPSDLPTADTLDAVVPPEQALHILDADSSQHEAIEAVKRGAHLVMDGPPGTGKSQTIANMIAEALAAGKTVLFVSEKTAALDVVKTRLDRCGVGDFCLELHSHKANKRAVVAELGRCLELPRVGAPDVAAQLASLADSRARLNTFVAELHATREPLGMSAYQVHGAVAELDHLPGRSRVAVPDVWSKGADFLRTCEDVLSRLAGCKAVLDNPKAHPWRGCKLDTFSQEAKDDARFHLNRLNGAVPAAESAVAALANAGVAVAVPSVPEWDSAVADARSLLGLPFFPAEWFTSDPRAAAGRAVELHQAVLEERDLAAKLPEFDLAAVATADTAALAGVNADRERLTANVSLRGRLAAIQHVIPAVRRLQSLAVALDAAAREVSSSLALPRVPLVEAIAGCLARGAVIGRTGAGSRSWWDAGRRKELLAVVTQAVAQEEAARVARVQLIRLALAAFAPEASAVVRDAAHAGRSFWSRLLPRWWSLKARVAAWYTEPPTGAALRADLAKLAAYHRNADAVRQTAVAYAADLARDKADGVPWQDTADALRAVEELSAAGATFDALSRQDRKAIGDRAEALRKAHAAFAEYAAVVARDFVLPDLAKRTPAEVAAWLADEVAALEREASGLRALAHLLAPGLDVAAPRVRAAADSVTRFAAVAVRVRKLAEGQPTDATVRAERAALGAELLRFLDRWTRPLTPQLADVLTQKTARDLLKPAIAQSEAARGGTFATAWQHVTQVVFDPTAEVSDGVVLNALPLSVLAQWAADRAADADRVFEWVRFVQVERAATAAGLGAVIEEVKAGEFPAEHAAGAFKARFLRLWLDALHERVPVLGAFTADAHERLIGQFADLDRMAVRTAAGRARAELLAKPHRPRARDGAPDNSELGILLREVNKKRRHLPLRNLFAKMPTILPRLKPCLMMSPLAVSTYLASPDFAFDIVIFDEASQVRPHDAICAIYRGKQLVVGGDPKQLPPTDFFARTGEEGDDAPSDDSGTAGFESLLNVCLGMGLCRKRLRWHYRSRREGLIAFSNQHFYGGTLVTFPSADEATTPAVQFVRVADGRFKDGVNATEARCVAELVMRHARAQPEVSLGVIAFSQRQQDRILDELEILRRAGTDTEAFFAADRADAFFVKNLENVQGDERDVVMLSVGYGPDAAGKVMMRFGPLNRSGGERRLNVAVTRARRGMTVVSSMTAGDIDLSRTSADGAKLLRAFLDYAERGPVALAAIGEADRRDFDGPFERAVCEELQSRGLTVHRQVGCGGYRIDLAITEGASAKYLLGVQCDGATYHSAATARDRDRLRRAVLEGLGWHLVRVWSTDWVRDRNAQVNRVLAALERAKDGPPPRPGAPEPELPPPKPPKEPKPPEPDHDSIEEVSDAEVSAAVTGALIEFGAMPADELIASASKRLGFKRVGPKIRERVAGALNALLGNGTLSMIEGDRIRVNQKQ